MSFIFITANQKSMKNANKKYAEYHVDVKHDTSKDPKAKPEISNKRLVKHVHITEEYANAHNARIAGTGTATYYEFVEELPESEEAAPDAATEEEVK